MNKLAYFIILNCLKDSRTFAFQKIPSDKDLSYKLYTNFRNVNLPICVNCLHFIEEQNNYPYDPLPNSKNGKCKKFGEINLVTGSVEYDFAQNCRDNNKKCGMTGKFYEEKTKS